MTFDRSSLCRYYSMMTSFLSNALSKFGFYPSLFQLSLAGILFSIFLLYFWILREPAVFDFNICVNFCIKLIIALRRRAEPFHYNFKNVSKLTHLFLMHLFSTPENRKVFWSFQGVVIGCIGNKWVNQIYTTTSCHTQFLKNVNKPGFFQILS